VGGFGVLVWWWWWLGWVVDDGAPARALCPECVFRCIWMW
jgi:hypothetical protein